MRHNYLVNENNGDYYDSFFKDLFDYPFTRENRKDGELLKTDIKDKGDSYLMSVDVPSVKKENIKIGLNNGYLTISASTSSSNEETEEKNEKFIHKERYYGSMERSYYVGSNIKKEDISAKLNDGVLFLTIKKNDNNAVENNNFIAIE